MVSFQNRRTNIPSTEGSLRALLKRARECIQENYGMKTQFSTSVWENKCFTLSLKIILENVTIVKSLCDEGIVREELRREYHVQMVVNQGKHFYIYEPTGLISGDVAKPLPTYKKINQPETSETYGIYIIIPKNMKNFHSDHLLTINVKTFDLICSEIREEDGTSFSFLAHNQIFEENGDGSFMDIDFPNPWRLKSRGCIIQHVQITLYSDDISGNMSKQWNKHMSITVTFFPPKLWLAAWSWLNQSYKISSKNILLFIRLRCTADTYVLLYLYNIANYQLWDILLLTAVSRKRNNQHSSMPSNSNNPGRACQLSVNSRNDKNSASYLNNFLRFPEELSGSTE
ncbi:hypothetical protein VP01_2251g4 [Puccinia sorghi]|uniref:Uncharacterized protein n=1 Tax=Puccinia sorghi TaxID=27349 RepID=A0A0L6V953_9BASI|nr:hypothetical protein VP01_2251g4 [Puccinia sorghi]